MRFSTLIIKNLLRRKTRTALTAVGVSLSIGTMVALLGIAEGFNQSFAEVYQKRGIDMVVVQAGTADSLASYLDERVGKLLERLSGVNSVTPGLVDLVAFKEAGMFAVPVSGRKPDSLLSNDLKILRGRRLQVGDKQAVLLGMILAKNLGKQTGDSVAIGGQEFQVVGVYESFSTFENGSAVMPLKELQRLKGRLHQVTGFLLVLNGSGDKSALVDSLHYKIEEMKDEQGRSLNLAAHSTQDHVGSAMQVRIARAMALLTSIIALFIGSIGMLNTMTTAVLERTREIAILRAIGWRKSRVIRMVLGESLLLCISGAVNGILTAIITTRLMSSLPAVNGLLGKHIPGSVILEGFLLAILVGLIGGVSPAYRAARLLPTEGLRHE